MQLQPRELYRLTPREYTNLIRGRELQIDDEMNRAAIVAMMNRKAQHKKTLKLSELVGKKKSPSVENKRDETGEKSDVLQALDKQLGSPQ